MSLFDTLKQNLLNQPKPNYQLGQGQAVQQVLQAKQGKTAMPGTGPRASNLGEAAMVDQTKALQSQQQQQNQLQAQAIDQQQVEQQRQQQQQNAEIESKRQSMLSQAQTNVDNILGQAQREGRQLTFEQDANTLEQLGFQLRLQDKQYVQKLQIEAGKQRLTDANNFNVAMQKAVLGNNYDLLKDKLDLEAALSADANVSKEELSKIDVNAALAIAAAQAKSAQIQQQWTGAGQIVTGGAKAAALYSPSSTDNSTSGVDVSSAGMNQAGRTA
jgi:hypothetical protein